MLFGSKSPSTSVNIGRSCIEQSDKEKLIGITVDKDLGFKSHVDNICKKIGQKNDNSIVQTMCETRLNKGSMNSVSNNLYITVGSFASFLGYWIYS